MHYMIAYYGRKNTTFQYMCGHTYITFMAIIGTMQRAQTTSTDIELQLS